MASENNPWFKKSDIGSGLIVSAIAGIVALAWEWYKAAPVLATFKQWWQFLGDAFSNIVNYQIRLWWLVISLLIIRVGMIAYYVYKRKQVPTDEELSKEMQIKTIRAFRNDLTAAQAKEAKMLNYTADKFLNLTWEWIWVWNKKIQQHEVKQLFPCCPNPSCDLERMFHDYTISNSDFYQCPNCEKFIGVRHNGTSLFHEIEQEIMQKVASF